MGRRASPKNPRRAKPKAVPDTSRSKAEGGGAGLLNFAVGMARRCFPLLSGAFVCS